MMFIVRRYLPTDYTGDDFVILCDAVLHVGQSQDIVKQT